MLPYAHLISLDRAAATPVYQQIANRLTGLIQQGVIRPGAELPSSREMAALLQVHRKTVVAAYEELYAQDWITTIPRKGIQVSQRLPEIKPRSFKAAADMDAYAGSTGFSFEKMIAPPGPARDGQYRLVIDDGFPDARIAPVDSLLKECRSLYQRPAIRKAIAWADLAGAPGLRTAITAFMADTRGLHIRAGNVMITRGAQMAIFMAARLLLRPGATVLTAGPNYYMADMIFQQFGARLQRIPIDDQGMDINAVERYCRRKRPDLLYIIPHHHHPTTVTLGADRRMHLLRLIREYKFPVIEDDYDYDFHYASSPILPLASADHGGNVIYIGSLTKSLAPFIRMGYMIAPETFIREAAALRRMIDIRGDHLQEEALAQLFRDGVLQRHLKRSVKLYHERRDHWCRLLETRLGHAVTFRPPAGGLAAWVQFNRQYSLPAIAARAAEKGLWMSDGSNYSYGTAYQNALRMGFASLNEREMKEAVGIIESVV